MKSKHRTKVYNDLLQPTGKPHDELKDRTIWYCIRENKPHRKLSGSDQQCCRVIHYKSN